MSLLLLACATTPQGERPPDSADTGRDSSGVDSAADTADTAHDTDTADTGDTADSGPDPDTLDQDGDGYRPLDGDCDDTLPHVYPGAPDYCDGLDQDCDGEPIPDGSCGEVGDATAMWTWAIEGGEERKVGALEGLGDVDGDGRADLAVHAYDSDSVSGPLTGKSLDQLPARGPVPALAWSGGMPSWAGTGATRAADVDADGYDDVWADCDSSGGYTGGLFLFLGRPEGFGDDEVRQDLLADAWWSDRPALEFYQVATGADVTGDGFADAVALLYDGTREYLALVAGSAAPSGHAEFEVLPRVLADVDFNEVDAYLQADLDGDGFDEWVSVGGAAYGDWDTLTIVEGEDLVDGAAVSDVGNVSWVEGEGANWLVSYGADQAPDIDGDGLHDLQLTVVSDAGDSLLLLSGGVPTGPIDGLAHTALEGEYPLAWHSTDDFDGDDIRDLAVHKCLAGSVQLSRGGTLRYPEDLFGCADWAGLPAATLDMTGDGLPERVVNEFYWYPEGSAYYYNRVLIIEGFPIPWDDPTKW